jgi:hypothetical protein
MSPSSPSSSNTAGAATQVIEAAERTMAVGTARLVLQQPPRDTATYVMGHMKTGCNPATPVFWLWKVVTDRLPDVVAESGWVDFVGRRYELDAGHWMVRADGVHRYTGRNASRLRRHRRPQMSSTLREPLWLIELLRGTVEAEEMGTEDVRGVVCRHFAVVADFPRAAAASQCGLAQPLVPPEALCRKLGIEVWDGRHIGADVVIDSAGLVRRINVRGFLLNVTMELFDFGDAVD